MPSNERKTAVTVLCMFYSHSEAMFSLCLFPFLQAAVCGTILVEEIKPQSSFVIVQRCCVSAWLRMSEHLLREVKEVSGTVVVLMMTINGRANIETTAHQNLIIISIECGAHLFHFINQMKG